MKRLFLLGYGSLFSPWTFAASVSFVEPADGATVPTTFPVKFAVEGMDVKPAGELSATSGHHHSIIAGNWITAGESVPFEQQHIHSGKGQTSATITLNSGTCQLTPQFANRARSSFGEPLGKTITVNLK